MIRSLSVHTPSRLHFGLTSLGGGQRDRHFGGIGAMIDVGGITLEASPADQFQARGSLTGRVTQVAERFARHYQLSRLPGLALRVTSAPPEHVGLGVGTQLALAVATVLSVAIGKPWDDPALLTTAAGRGRRSAVGTYGFCLGGLIVDGGRTSEEPLGQLVERVALPPVWRFVLTREPRFVGRSGAGEKQAMDALPPVPPAVTAELERLIHTEILPAAKGQDFPEFSAAIFNYGKLAGECFAEVQGGPFANAHIAGLVHWIREQRIMGVGQSSWGPTVYSILPDEEAARAFKEKIEGHPRYQDCEVTVAKPANRGAIVAERELACHSRP